MNNDETFKNELFMDADFYSESAKECYEIAHALEAKKNAAAAGWLHDADEYQFKFQMVLKKLQWLGWDKEYMGIA